MATSPSPSRDLSWYRSRWEELLDLLPTSDPDEVVDQVRELQVSVLDEEAEALEEMGLADAQDAKTVLRRIFSRLQELRRDNQALEEIQEVLSVDGPSDAVESTKVLRDRVDALEEEQSVLTEAGFERPEHAVEAIASMKDQLDELYGEKEVTLQSAGGSADPEAGDTFDQLKALMAREETLQRELGVASPDEVIELVEGLTEQLEDLYRERESEPAPPAGGPASESLDQLEAELGVSDPEAIVTMVNDLTDQLDALYTSRERLAELNITETSEAIEMLRSMQHQLEAIYKRRERMSEHGIDGIDHALSMISSMEEQLGELYEERRRLAELGVDRPDDVSARLENLETKLSTLKEEKDVLRQKRNQLQDQIDALEDKVGLQDPDAISDLIGSMQEQLRETYAEQEASRSLPDSAPLLEDDTLDQLEDLSGEALDAIPAGAFCLDDQGTIRRASSNALRWPDVDADTPDELVGQNFFNDLAPGTNNSLFRGRFEDGVNDGSMDERFLYTYVSKHAPPTNLAVHLHSKPTEPVNWILFRRL